MGSKPVRAGIFGWFGFVLPMEERARLIKAAGFDSAMLWWGDEFAESFGAKERHPDIFRKAGLNVENVHLPYYGIDDIWTDSLNGEDLFRLLLDGVQSCRDCGADAAVMHLEDGKSEQPPGDTGLQRVKRLVDAAERADITLAVENLRSVKHLDYVFGNLKSPKLKFCYDSGHAFCCGVNADILQNYGHLLAALHLHDNDGTADMHRLPFGGKIDWPGIMSGLDALGYDGPLMLEVDASFYDSDLKLNAEAYLAEAYKRAERLHAMRNK